MYDFDNPVPKPMCGTAALAKLGILPNHTKRRQFQFLRKGKTISKYNQMPIELTPINMLFVTEQEFNLGNTSLGTASTLDPINSLSIDSGSIPQFDTSTGMIYQVQTDENLNRAGSNTPTASNKASHKHFDFSMDGAEVDAEAYFDEEDAKDLPGRSRAISPDHYECPPSPLSTPGFYDEELSTPPLPRRALTSVDEAGVEDYAADSSISTKDTLPLKQSNSLDSNLSDLDMLVNMRNLILKQQHNLELLNNKNNIYRESLEASHGRVQDLRKDHLDSMDSMIKLQFERESFEAEAVWLREELKAIRGELGSLKQPKLDGKEGETDAKDSAIRISSPSKEATSEVRWSRTQSFLLSLKPVVRKDQQVVEEPLSPMSISCQSQKSNTSLPSAVEEEDSVWTEEELPEINVASSPKSRSPPTPQQKSLFAKKSLKHSGRFQDSVRKDEMQQVPPEEASDIMKPSPPKATSPQPSTPQQSSRKAVRSQSSRNLTVSPNKKSADGSPKLSVRFSPPTMREISDETTSYPSPQRSRRTPLSPTSYFNEMMDAPAVSPKNPKKEEPPKRQPKLVVQTGAGGESQFAAKAEGAQPSSPQGRINSPSRQHQFEESRSTSPKGRNNPPKSQSRPQVEAPRPTSPRGPRSQARPKIEAHQPSSPREQLSFPSSQSRAQVEVPQPASPKGQGFSPRSQPRAQVGAPRPASPRGQSCQPIPRPRHEVMKSSVPEEQQLSPRKKSSHKSKPVLRLGSHPFSPKKQIVESKTFFPEEDPKFSGKDPSAKDSSLPTVSSGDESLKILIDGKFSVNKKQLKSLKELSPRSRYLEAAMKSLSSSREAAAPPPVEKLDACEGAPVPQIKLQSRPSKQPVINQKPLQTYPSDIQIQQAMSARSKAQAKSKKPNSRTPLGWSPTQQRQSSSRSSSSSVTSTSTGPSSSPGTPASLRKRGSRHIRHLEHHRRNSEQEDPSVQLMTKQFVKAKRQADDPSMSYAERNAELRWVKSQQMLLKAMKTSVDHKHGMSTTANKQSLPEKKLDPTDINDLQRRADKVRMDLVKANLDATEEREGRDECSCDEGRDHCSAKDARSRASRQSPEPREFPVVSSRMSRERNRQGFSDEAPHHSSIYGDAASYSSERRLV
jgi:hypothetical protein